MDAFERAEMTRKLRRLESQLEEKKKMINKNVVVYEEHSDDKAMNKANEQLEAISKNVALITTQLSTFATDLAEKLQFMKNTYPADVSVAQMKSGKMKRKREDKEYIPDIKSNATKISKTTKKISGAEGIDDAMDALSGLER